MSTATLIIPWRVSERPAGDFAVQRFQNGQNVRYGVRKTRAAADRLAETANRLNPGPVRTVPSQFVEECQ